MKYTMDLVDVIIGAAALVIAIIEFVSFIKASITARRKRKLTIILCDWAQKATETISEVNKLELNNAFAFFMSFLADIQLKQPYKIMRNVLWGNVFAQRSDGDNYFEGVTNFISCTNEVYQQVYECCKQMSEILLDCESEFSLSYGFGRYIDVLRPLIYDSIYDDYKKAAKRIEEFSEKADKRRKDLVATYVLVINSSDEPGEWFDKEILDSVKKDYDNIIYKWNNSISELIKEYNRILPYINEMIVKFGRTSTK